MAKSQVKGSETAKEKPPNQRVRRQLFPLFRWWLCPVAMPKQHQAVLGSTKTRAQKPVPVIPTLSCEFAAASFQLIPVRSTVFAILPPNPAVGAAVHRLGPGDVPRLQAARRTAPSTRSATTAGISLRSSPPSGRGSRVRPSPWASLGPRPASPRSRAGRPRPRPAAANPPPRGWRRPSRTSRRARGPQVGPPIGARGPCCR